MKKINHYLDLSLPELNTKQQDFVKDLIISRLSMDATALTSATNLQNLMRELKLVNRIKAIKKKNVKIPEVSQ